jgi:ribonuclease HII
MTAGSAVRSDPGPKRQAVAMPRSSVTADLHTFDASIARDRTCVIVGLDEAGRGPLAGPVVAAAVRLDPARPIDGVDDSKKLTPKKRDELFEAITNRAIAWSVAFASPEEIDRINILRASLLAMHRALETINTPWTLALIDGNQPIRELAPARQQTIIGGDGRSASIAAASIIAKVTRDRIMQRYHAEYPLYNFNVHKGYATLLHRQRILMYGLSPIHRRSFCERLMLQTTLPLDIPTVNGCAP